MEIIVALIALIVAAFGGWAAKAQHGKARQLKAKDDQAKCRAEALRKARETADEIDRAHPDDARARLLAKARLVLGTDDPDAAGRGDD